MYLLKDIFYEVFDIKFIFPTILWSFSQWIAVLLNIIFNSRPYLKTADAEPKSFNTDADNPSPGKDQDEGMYNSHNFAVHGTNTVGSQANLEQIAYNNKFITGAVIGSLGAYAASSPGKPDPSKIIAGAISTGLAMGETTKYPSKDECEEYKKEEEKHEEN